MFNFQCSIPDLCLCVGDDGRSRRRRRRSVFVIRTQKVVCWFWAALTTTPASPIHITGSIYLYYKKKNVGIFSPTPPILRTPGVVCCHSLLPRATHPSPSSGLEGIRLFIYLVEKRPSRERRRLSAPDGQQTCQPPITRRAQPVLLEEKYRISVSAGRRESRPAEYTEFTSARAGHFRQKKKGTFGMSPWGCLFTFGYLPSSCLSLFTPSI